MLPVKHNLSSEIGALAVRQWLENTVVRTLYIELGSPWENGYCESVNGKFRDALLDREVFYTLRETQALIERWHKEVLHLQTSQLIELSPACS